MAAGTGGHIFPGLAIGQELTQRGWRVHWMGTPAGMENKLVAQAGFPMTTVDVKGLRGKGIGIWLAVQAFINMGVNMGLLPTKGLTLPLLSFGGTGIVVNCMAIAILLRIDWENRYLMRGGRL